MLDSDAPSFRSVTEMKAPVQAADRPKTRETSAIDADVDVSAYHVRGKACEKLRR